MKKYCLDTSGISKPVLDRPDDIYGPIWRKVIAVIEAGEIAVTTEIYDEMHGSIWSMVGQCIDANKDLMVLEIADDSWDYARYVQVAAYMQMRHREFIAEHNKNRKDTVGLNDISIIALGKTLDLPVVSMESSAAGSMTKRRIPDICNAEQVEHLDFNDFLRQAGIGMG
ncbi:hypothetical protein BH23CHL3_BH23CHL3_06420 [soil metagenome]